MNIYLFFLIFAVCLLSGNASKEVFKMPAKYSEKSKSVGQKCIKENGAPSDFMEKLFPWNYPKDELYEKALYCYVTSIGLINQEGIFYADKVNSVFTSSAKFEDIKKAFEECSGERGSSPQATTYMISECFFDKVPIKFFM